MRRKIIWGLALLALIATPAVIGLVLVGGNDNARSKAALVGEGEAGAAAYQLVVDGLPMPAGQAIDVMSYSWGVTNPGGAPETGGAAGKAVFGNLEVTKKLDETSPLFVKGAALGKAYATAVLKLYKAGGPRPSPYATYTLKNVYIASVQHGGTADAVPTEQISFTYTNVTLEIFSLTDAGELGGSNKFGFDIAMQKVS